MQQIRTQCARFGSSRYKYMTTNETATIMRMKMSSIPVFMRIKIVESPQSLDLTPSLPRLAYDELVRWKQRPVRKPVLLDGARQVGKSWLIGRLFGPKEFRKVHWLDFREEPRLGGLFAGSLSPEAVIENLEVESNETFDLASDLLFLDEVGECQRAVDSLKYFAERLPHAFVCASGSNIGLLRSFPVGKVERLELFPLCFEEFLMAANQPALLRAYRNGPSGTTEPRHGRPCESDKRRFRGHRTTTVHRHLWAQLLNYYFVGGMPEAVAAWFLPGQGLLDRTDAVVNIHRDLIDGYRRDFGKYSGKADAQHIEQVFDNIPRQLAASLDGSVARYRFKGVLPHRERYRDLAGPVDWLEKARLVWKCSPLQGKPDVPLSAHVKDNRFRLYLFDVGLLGHMLGMTYADQQAQRASYKGYIAENFVQTELSARVGHPTYGWYEARAEVEFLHRDSKGNIVPVEVKSGSRTKARSLRSFIDRYAPRRAIKLVGSGGGSSGLIETWPLYDAQFLGRL